MDHEVAFYLAQGVSVVTGILAISMMQFKNMRAILLFQIISNLLASTNYLLLGGDTGAIVSVLAIAQSVVMYFYNCRSKEPHKSVVATFILAYVAFSAYNVISSRDLMELLPAFSAICFAVSLLQKKPSNFRIFGALNPSFWLPYDLYTEAYVMFFVHFGILVSCLWAMIKLDGFLGIMKKKD